jgi:hypothetical protein
MMAEASASPDLHLTAHDGLLTIKNESGAPLLADCWAGVTLADGALHTTAGQAQRTSTPDGGLLVESAGNATRPPPLDHRAGRIPVVSKSAHRGRKHDRPPPISATMNWEQHTYALDTKNPAVVAWLGEVFRTIIQD